MVPHPIEFAGVSHLDKLDQMAAKLIERYPYSRQGASQFQNVADNAVDLLIGMMKGYGAAIETVLQYASCLGTRFCLKALHSDTDEGAFQFVICTYQKTLDLRKQYRAS